MASLRSIALPLCLSLLLVPAGVLAKGATASSCAPASTPAFLSVMNGSDYTGCLSTVQSGQSFLLVNVVMNSVPAKKVHFSLPDPSFGTILGASWNAPASGDIHTGIDLTFASCTAGGVTVLGMLFVSIPTGTINGCVDWKMDAGCSIEDCDGNVRTATNWGVWFTNAEYCLNCFQQCQALPPWGLSPPDGAINLPTNTQLSWTGGMPVGFGDCYVQISTDPDCGNAQTFPVACDSHTYVPDFLQPGTTYYWRARWFETGAGCDLGGSTPIRSFKTAGPVATQPTSWGQVKSMYRE
jgi:hypothetical protein